MDIRNFSVEELLSAAYRAEIESERTYNDLSGVVKNNYLRYRMEFLAGEERLHQAFIMDLFRSEYPEKEMDMNLKTPVPLPVIDLKGDVLVSEVFAQVMVSEKAASDFYLALAEMFDHDSSIDAKLRYLSNMEMGHYRLIESEKEFLEKDEDYDVSWPMMHAGP